MKAIVTVKLNRPNVKHDPRNKRIGNCPINNNVFCSDKTGSHHSYIEEGIDLIDIENKASKKYSHVTRIEVIDFGDGFK